MHPVSDIYDTHGSKFANNRKKDPDKRTNSYVTF